MSQEIIITNDNVNNVIFDGVTVKKSGNVTNTELNESVKMQYTFDLSGMTLSQLIDPYVQNRVIAIAPRIRKQIKHYQKNTTLLIECATRFTGRKPKRSPMEKTLSQAQKAIDAGTDVDELIKQLQALKK